MNFQIQPFNIAHYTAMNPTINEVNAAIISQISGPAYTILTDEKKPKVLACGGIRMEGIGQGWIMFHPDSKKYSVSLLRRCRLVMEECIQNERIYRIYAEASKEADPDLFEFLGFKQSDKLYVR